MEWLLRNKYYIMSIAAVAIMVFGWYLNWRVKLPPEKVSPIVLGSLATVTLFFTALTFEYNHHKNLRDAERLRNQLTFNTAVEWNRPPISEHIRLLTKYQRELNPYLETKDAKLFWQFLTDERREYSLQLRSALAGILNYFEYVSLGIEKGLIDEAFIREFFESIFVKYLENYLFYIEFRRAENEFSEMSWAKFTEFATKWRDDPAYDNLKNQAYEKVN